jgi:chaperonin GroES
VFCWNALKKTQKTLGGIIIPDSAKEKPMKGKVIAVGSGVLGEVGKLFHWMFKAGDVVLFSKWSGTEVNIDGKELLVMKESDIMGRYGRLGFHFYLMLYKEILLWLLKKLNSLRKLVAKCCAGRILLLMR